MSGREMMAIPPLRPVLLRALLIAAAAASCACSPAAHVRFGAVYVDLDGTVLGTDHRVRPATVRALERYKACGGQVGVATGRTLEQVKPFLADLAPTLPVVLFNGALSVDPDSLQVRAVRYLEPKVVVKVLEAGKDDPDLIGIVVHDVEETVIDRSTEELDRELAAGLIQPSRVLEGNPSAFSGRAVKVMLLTRSGKVEGVASRISAVVDDGSRALVTSPRTVEVVAPGVNKANAVLTALSEAGIDPKQTLLFGDSGNDVEMLSTVGIGFAMGNCRPEACQAALFRIGDNGTDAIAEVIERLALLPSCPSPRPSQSEALPSQPNPISGEAPKTE